MMSPADVTQTQSRSTGVSARRNDRGRGGQLVRMHCGLRSSASNAEALLRRQLLTWMGSDVAFAGTHLPAGCELSAPQHRYVQ